MDTTPGLLRLYPAPQRECAIEGLYLDHEMGHADRPQEPFVYTNFISSLDGRIAVKDPGESRPAAPKAITNARDWRLFQELAARADALIVSGSFLRNLALGQPQHKLPLSNDHAFDDLHDWRKAQGMPAQPAVVVLSRSLDLPLAQLCRTLERRVYVAVGRQVHEGDRQVVEATGAHVLTAGGGQEVTGKALIDALGREGFRNIYSIAGPQVLETLLRDRVLHRLYLTHFHRLIGGRSFETLLDGERLDPPVSCIPRALYYDPKGGDEAGQFFAVYDTC